MKPLFTFVIPAYNGEPFLDQSIHSLTAQRIFEEGIDKWFEVIIVNDGSKDNTAKLAQELADKWNKESRKDFIRVINKPNGQYGSVINRGIKEANGLYFKVLDCDDTFNVTSLINMLYMVAGFEKHVDVIFTDHTFEKVASNKKEVNSLRKYFEPYKVINLQKQPFPKDLITMHSIIYRTDLLKETKYEQIEGVYYSDSQYSLFPLAHAQTMYYMELPLYRYYIGRNEQSINLKVMVRNRKHQYAVLEKIWKDIDLDKIENKTVKAYIMIVMRRMVQWQMMLMSFDKSIDDKRQALKDLMKHLKGMQPKYSKHILKGSLFIYMKVTGGRTLPFAIRLGMKLYAKFKKNIMAEWD